MAAALLSGEAALSALNPGLHLKRRAFNHRILGQVACLILSPKASDLPINEFYNEVGLFKKKRFRREKKLSWSL